MGEETPPSQQHTMEGITQGDVRISLGLRNISAFPKPVLPFPF